MDSIEIIGERLARVTEELGDPFNIDRIMISFMKPDWSTGNGIFKGECMDCSAFAVTKAESMTELLWFADSLVRLGCAENRCRNAWGVV